MSYLENKFFDSPSLADLWDRDRKCYSSSVTQSITLMLGGKYPTSVFLLAFWFLLCVCVCVWERERERMVCVCAHERERERECVFVCPLGGPWNSLPMLQRSQNAEVQNRRAGEKAFLQLLCMHVLYTSDFSKYKLYEFIAFTWWFFSSLLQIVLCVNCISGTALEMYII